MGAKKEKKEKLPKGVGRLPEWWLEVTPHDSLFLKDDEAQKKAKADEAMKFAQLAAIQDLMDKYGGEDFPNWNPSTDGPRTKEEENEWISKGYKRNEQEKWVSEDDAPLEGRQFKGQMPAGYRPGDYGKDSVDGATEVGRGNLNSSKYERDEATAWDKPDWMKVKLRSTGTGGTVRQGETVEQPIIKGDGNVVSPIKSRSVADPEVAVVEAPQLEEPVDQHGREVGDIKSSAEIKSRATGELQAILNRRKHDDTGEGPNTQGDGNVVSADLAGGVVDTPEPEELIDQHGRDVGDIKSAAPIKSRATGELQAILNRRKALG